MQLIDEFNDKMVLIWGMGLEGKSTLAYLKKHLPGQLIYISDRKEPELGDYEVFVPEDKIDFDAYDIIMKAPGIEVKDENIRKKVTGQAALFLKYYGDRTIGITGTKGKSTTTSLMYHILQTAGIKSFLVGNIGIPCFNCVDEIDEDTWIAFEVSCHQLEVSEYAPHVGVLLNLFEEHLDHYGSYELYKYAKENIYRKQKENDIAIINMELQKSLEECPRAITAGKGADIDHEGKFLMAGSHCLDARECNLLGEHNYYNAAIDFYIAREILNIDDEIVKEALRTFETLKHRLQPVGTFKGVTYVDDSISTIGQATIQGIKALKNVQTVLIGGMDRGIDYKDLEAYLMNCKVEHIIMMYATGKRIYEEMEVVPEGMILVEDLQQAVEKAVELTKDGICLLSPAASSYDHFKNFEERGDRFTEWVNYYAKERS